MGIAIAMFVNFRTGFFAERRLNFR